MNLSVYVSMSVYVHRLRGYTSCNTGKERIRQYVTFWATKNVSRRIPWSISTVFYLNKKSNKTGHFKYFFVKQKCLNIRKVEIRFWIQYTEQTRYVHNFFSNIADKKSNKFLEFTSHSICPMWFSNVELWHPYQSTVYSICFFTVSSYI